MDICAFRFENGEYFSRLFDFRKISSLLDSLVFLRLVTRLKKRYLIELDIYSRSNFILFFKVPKKEKKDTRIEFRVSDGSWSDVTDDRILLLGLLSKAMNCQLENQTIRGR